MTAPLVATIARAQQGTQRDAPAYPAPTGGRASLGVATDLAADAAASERDLLPILLFFDRGDCPYCERALREYLVPMSGDERWRARVLFRQVEVDRELPLRDFAGAMTTHRVFADRYQITLVPTVLVVDAQGKALAPPVRGLLTVDFYAAYLERALEDALAKLRR